MNELVLEFEIGMYLISILFLKSRGVDPFMLHQLLSDWLESLVVRMT